VRSLTVPLVAVLLAVAAAPAHAHAALTVRWTDGDAHGQATVFSDLQSMKVCDWKNDKVVVGMKWGFRVLGMEHWFALKAPQGGCASHKWEPYKINTRIIWVRYCAGSGDGWDSVCRRRADFPDGA
jgi:hypothetical protein